MRAKLRNPSHHRWRINLQPANEISTPVAPTISFIVNLSHLVSIGFSNQFESPANYFPANLGNM